MEDSSSVANVNDFIAVGMSVKRRRRKKREINDDVVQDSISNLVGSPPLPFSPPHSDQIGCSANLKPANATVPDSEVSDVEPASSWDTTSGQSNTMSAVGNSVPIRITKSTFETTDHEKAKPKVVPSANMDEIQNVAHAKPNLSSTSQRAMIDCQKTRFARNLAEFQGGLHKCGVSVKDHIDVYRRFKQLAVTVPVESDSYTDNPAATKSQKPQRRHKRRIKKMAIDISPINTGVLDAVEPEGVSKRDSIIKDCHSISFGNECDGETGTLTRKKEGLLIVTGNRKSPWKNIPFKFPSEYSFSTSVANQDDSSNQTMEFDGQSSNTIEGPQSGTLNTSGISNQPVMSDTESQTSRFYQVNMTSSKTLSELGEETPENEANMLDTVISKDDVFVTSGSSESSLDTSSASHDDEGVAGIFTADEGREGDDELSENDDAHSVCGLPCAIPWWEDGEASEVAGRPQFDSQLQQILEGIKSVTDKESVDSFLQASNATLFHPGICKRTLPTSTDVRESQDNSSESYEHLTSPDGSSKSKRSRYSAMNGCSRLRYSKYYSGKHKKKRRRSYSGELKPKRDTRHSLPFRKCSEPPECLPETNVGHQMLLNMGWKPGSGLGTAGEGIAEPIVLSSQNDKKGFGYFADLEPVAMK